MLWTRWGRVGEQGQSEGKHFLDLDDATKAFKKKFSDKTKNKWDKRDDFVAAPGKYTLLEMDDEEDDGVGWKISFARLPLHSLIRCGKKRLSTIISGGEGRGG